jgi:putative oxidoreductase
MPKSYPGVASLIGRILISVMFLWSGIAKVAAFSMMTGYAQAKGLPLPAAGIATAAAIEILCGLAVLTGFQTKLASWALFVYLIPVTLLFHNFWAVQGADRMDAQVHFLKNVAIMGGLLILAASGAGGYSFDAARAVKA